MEKSYDWLKKFNKSVTLATEAVIIVLMAIMAVVTIAQVFMRYVMHSPIPWSGELARYFMAVSFTPPPAPGADPFLVSPFLF